MPERADLLRLAQGVQYPVYLDVTLRGDRVDAVTSAFASRGFSLSVQEKTDNPDDGLDLAGYMKDGLVEEQAFSAVREDVPELRDQAVWCRLDRTIRHADAVEAVLLPLLKEADLAFVQVRVPARKGGACGPIRCGPAYPSGRRAGQGPCGTRRPGRVRCGCVVREKAASSRSPA